MRKEGFDPFPCSRSSVVACNNARTDPVLDAGNGGVVRDQLVELTSARARRSTLAPIRRIEYLDSDTDKRYVFITNQMTWCAQTVADIYKSRWEIELFFKWIKQNLKIRSFLGHSINAVASQIFVALCLYLLMAYLKFVSRTAFSVHALLRLLQLNLFSRLPLDQLLHKPPPEPPSPQALLPLRFA